MGLDQTQTPHRRLDRRAAGYRTLALHALDRLSAGHTDPRTVHRLRTSLRRLEAYLEFAGDKAGACCMAKCVSRLSSLRTLQVLAGYLKRQGATQADAKKIRKRIKRQVAKLCRARIFENIQVDVRCTELVAASASPAWPTDRLAALRREQAATLRDLTARPRPRRRMLHALRLKIKSIRYQEEWALSLDAGKVVLVERLKQLQSVLGHYEDLAEFRKLARRYDLACSRSITKDWRLARRHARSVPPQLTDLIEDLAGRRFWPMPRNAPTRLTNASSSTISLTGENRPQRPSEPSLSIWPDAPARPCRG